MFVPYRWFLLTPQGVDLYCSSLESMIAGLHCQGELRIRLQKDKRGMVCSW